MRWTKVMHASEGGERKGGGEVSVARAVERDRCTVPSITSPHSRPLDQRVNNQLTRAGKEDVMNKGDASQGGKRRGEL